jgi:hypothetical protein
MCVSGRESCILVTRAQPVSSSRDLSVIERSLSGRFSRQFQTDEEHVGRYFETALMIRDTLNKWCAQGLEDSPLHRFRRAAREGPLIPCPAEDSFVSSFLVQQGFKPDFQDTKGHRWFRLPSLDRACEILSGLYLHLEAEAPIRTANAAHQTLVIPDRVEEMLALWNKGSQTRPLKAQIDHLRDALPDGCIPILAGSLSRQEDWTPYADVDLVCVLDRKILSDPAALKSTILAWRRSAPWWIRVDPLQHHGPFLFLPLDLEFFRTSYLPPETLERSTTLHGQSAELSIRRLADPLVAWSSIQSMNRATSRLLDSRRMRLDRHTMKYVVSMALLVPAVCCNVLDESVDKADSFERFRTLVHATAPPRSSSMDEALCRLEELRRGWKWSLRLPGWIIRTSGESAPWLSRNLNRFPSPSLARVMTQLSPGLEQIYQAAFDIIHSFSQDRDSREPGS